MYNTVKDWLAIGNEEIHIDEKNEGKFTQWCKRKGFDGVTDECIELGLKSKNPKTRKRALFAKNAKKWKHKKDITDK